MRYLLQSWTTRGSALLALALMLGCAPATEAPKTEVKTDTPVTDAPPVVEEDPTAMTETGGAVENATPVEDAAEERKDEAEAAGPDALDTSSSSPNVKLGEPEDPVNLK